MATPGDIPTPTAESTSDSYNGGGITAVAVDVDVAAGESRRHDEEEEVESVLSLWFDGCTADNHRTKWFAQVCQCCPVVAVGFPRVYHRSVY